MTHVFESRNNSVGVATCYGPNGLVFEFTKGKTFASLPKTAPTGTGTPASYSTVTEGKNNWVVKEILVTSLRISAAIPLFLYGFLRMTILCMTHY